MFKNFTYKQRFLGICVAAILLILACYKKTFKHILTAKSQLALVDEKLKNIENSDSEVFFLKNEINNIDNIIGGQTKHPEQVQKLLLDFVSNSDQKVDISSISDTHIYTDGEFTIYTNSVEIKGQYNDLVNLCYEIERRFDVSKLISAKLFTVKNYRNNTKSLYLKLILQNYEKNT